MTTHCYSDNDNDNDVYFTFTTSDSRIGKHGVAVLAENLQYL